MKENPDLLKKIRICQRKFGFVNENKNWNIDLLEKFEKE